MIMVEVELNQQVRQHTIHLSHFRRPTISSKPHVNSYTGAHLVGIPALEEAEDHLMVADRRMVRRTLETRLQDSLGQWVDHLCNTFGGKLSTKRRFTGCQR